MPIEIHPLLWPVALPLAGAALCLLLPRFLSRLAPLLAVALAAGVTWLAWTLFAGGAAKLDLAGILAFRLDHLSAFVMLVVSAFTLLIAFYSWGYLPRPAKHREYYGYLLATLGAANGAVLANDLILLLVFWGFLGVTLYLLISLRGPQAAAAAKKSFILVGGSDAVLLLGIGLIWHLTGSLRLDGPAIPLSGAVSHTAFLAFALAAFAKAGAMPLHTWVPDFGEHADAPVTAFLPASLDKLLGIYLLFRASTGLFQLNGAMQFVLLAVGAATVLAAVMMALVQHDLKRLLSYHAVSQVGYMLLGIGTGLPLGLAGGLFHMLNHAMYKSCLFLCAGNVETQAGTTDLERLGGLAKVMPLTFLSTLVASLAISGLPPLNGFASKWMIYQGLIELGGRGGAWWVVWLAVAMFGSALTLASFVKVLHSVFLRRTGSAPTAREAGWRMILPVVLLAAGCVAFGVAAFRLPLPLFIFPSLSAPVSAPGLWWAGPATALLLAAMAAGLLMYVFTRIGRVREAATYIGGETLDDEAVQLTGVDFYRTVSDLPPLAAAYRLAEKKYFDLYAVGTGLVMYFSEALKELHTGRLPWYLTWVLFGLVVMLFLLRG
ncbi:MAG: proton-conducting transporter membrane subunit [candidate division FCPU426 bacterium]